MKSNGQAKHNDGLGKIHPIREPGWPRCRVPGVRIPVLVTWRDYSETRPAGSVGILT